jgi:hypothetical protein
LLARVEWRAGCPNIKQYSETAKRGAVALDHVLIVAREPKKATRLDEVRNPCYSSSVPFVPPISFPEE